MFDLRYHVASLTAVFVALVIGILVGVGLSGKGFVNDAERANLNGQIADLQNERDAARASARRGGTGRAGAARLRRRRLPGGRARAARGQAGRRALRRPGRPRRLVRVEKAVLDAGGTVVRTRSISAPLDMKAVQETLRRQPRCRKLAGSTSSATSAAPSERARAGGKTPLWDALGQIIVLEREGPSTPPADALVVVRTAEPQTGPTKRVPRGALLGSRARRRAGRRDGGPRRVPTAMPAFAKAGLSTVDAIDGSTGGSASCSSCRARSRAATAWARRPRTASCRRSRPPAPGVSARPDRPRRRARRGGPDRRDGRRAPRGVSDAEVVVADDGSRDGTAAVAEDAGARVLRLPAAARARR